MKQRFLNVGNHYYFPDRTLAFTDDGLKLKAESHNTEVVRGVLAIAEARNWTSIRGERLDRVPARGVAAGAVAGHKRPWLRASDVERPLPVGSRWIAAAGGAAGGPAQNVAVPGAAASRPALNQTITGVLTESRCGPVPL